MVSACCALQLVVSMRALASAVLNHLTAACSCFSWRSWPSESSSSELICSVSRDGFLTGTNCGAVDCEGVREMDGVEALELGLLELDGILVDRFVSVVWVGRWMPLALSLRLTVLVVTTLGRDVSRCTALGMSPRV